MYNVYIQYSTVQYSTQDYKHFQGDKGASAWTRSICSCLIGSFWMIIKVCLYIKCMPVSHHEYRRNQFVDICIKKSLEWWPGDLMSLKHFLHFFA